jgi:hypothetical protein
MSKPQQQRGLSMERLLMEIVQGLGHLHAMLHRIESKVDAINSGGGDDSAAVAALNADADKLSTSSDELKETVEETGEQT